MAKTLTTFGGNVASVPARKCECILCGKVQAHDVCNTCHMSEPDGSMDTDAMDDLIADDLRSLADTRL